MTAEGVAGVSMAPGEHESGDGTRAVHDETAISSGRMGVGSVSHKKPAHARGPIPCQESKRSTVKTARKPQPRRIGF